MEKQFNDLGEYMDRLCSTPVEILRRTDWDSLAVTCHSMHSLLVTCTTPHIVSMSSDWLHSQFNCFQKDERKLNESNEKAPLADNREEIT